MSGRAMGYGRRCSLTKPSTLCWKQRMKLPNISRQKTSRAASNSHPWISLNLFMRWMHLRKMRREKNGSKMKANSVRIEDFRWLLLRAPLGLVSYGVLEEKRDLARGDGFGLKHKTLHPPLYNIITTISLDGIDGIP